MRKFALTCSLLLFSSQLFAQSRIFFPEEVRQYGHIRSNSDGKRHFVFTNTGDSALHIYQCKTSSGAVTASWPQKPIQVGEWAQITVNFHTGGGRQGRFQKTIAVYSSDSLQPLIILRIRGRIMKEGDPLYDEEITEASVYQAKHVPLDSMSFRPMIKPDTAEQETSYYLQIDSHTTVDVSSPNQLIYDCHLAGDTLVMDYRYLEMGPSDPEKLKQKHQESFQMPTMPGHAWIIKATYNRREVLMNYAIEESGCASLWFVEGGKLLRCGE